MFAAWMGVVILIGAVLTSYHQPFRTPDDTILALAPPPEHSGWQAIHILSGSCGCSQRVMSHLLERRPRSDIHDQIVVLDGEEPYLPGSRDLLAQLSSEGFPITHLAVASLPQNIGLRGVPLLVLASSTSGSRNLAYIGGYGSRGDQDGEIFEKIRSGQTPKPFTVVGCAIGKALRRKADPFHLKY